MSLIAYLVAVYFIWLALAGYRQSHATIGAGVDGGWGLVNEICGTICSFGGIALFVAGFFWFSWYVPIAALLVLGMLATITRQSLPIGATYCIFGTPIACVAILLGLLLR